MDSKILSPLIPFLVPTGRPDRETIRRKLRGYISQDINQFLIYPRDGIGFQHLSDEWFSMWEDFVAVAVDEGAYLWIYDDLWPSGRAAEIPGMPGRILDGTSEFAAMTLVGAGEAELSWSIVRSKLQPDLLNPRVTEKFIAVTHEEYANRFKKYFGTVIRGLFTDEPSYFHNACLAAQADNMKVRVPYYDGIEDDYRSIAGSVLKDDIARDVNDSRVWKIYYDLLGRRFASSYFAPLRKWCDGHNLLFTGHICDETHNGVIVSMQGRPFDCLAEMSLPGVDEIKTAITPEDIQWTTWKFGQSVIERGKRGGITEIFALGPCDLSMAKMRLMIFLSAAHGIDNYVLAISPFDLRAGMTRHGFLSDISPDQPWFAHAKELARESTIAAAFARMKVPPSIYIRFPRSAMAVKHGAMPSGWCDRRDFDAPLHELIKTLSMAQWPVRLIDEDEPLGDRKAILIVSLEDDVVVAARDDGMHMRFNSTSALCDYIETHYTRPIAVRLRDGTLPDSLLVSSSDDGGEFLVLNLSEKPLPECVLTTAERTYAASLEPFGIVSSKHLFPAQNENMLSNATPTFTLQLSGTNFMRCSFAEADAVHRCVFSIDDYHGPIRVIARKEQSAAISLDGTPLFFRHECTSLPEGLAVLYSASSPIMLPSGDHELTFTSQNTDHPYLPLCFIAGDFGLFDDNRLSALPSTAVCGDLPAQGLRQFSGAITLSADVRIPEHAAHIGIYCGDAAVSLAIDGIDLGVRCWGPYRWNIPAGIRGRQCRVTATIHTSIAPLFGDYDKNCASSAFAKTYWLRDFWPERTCSKISDIRFY